MTESKICTCPSGDGSLRWPCPAHPAVEQAGGDERAAFEVWASALGWKLSPDQNNCGIVVAERYGHPGVQRCWEAWQARAALAQPSPAQAEKAEVERTEGSADLLAIVREAVAGAYNEWKMISEAVTEIMEAHERIVGELRADRDSWAEQAEQRLADWDEMRKERDAALARVEQQESTIAGMNEAHAKLAGLYEAAQAQHSVPDHAELLQALERTHAGHMVGHDQSDQPKGGYSDGYVNGFGECIKVARKVLAASPAQAQHSVPDGAADLCRFLAKLYCELDGLRYSTAKLPAEQIADALIFKWPVLQGARNQLNIKRISEQPYDESKLHSAIAAMLAAAPGKEGRDE
ncbi:hypothetical protein JEY83_07370 [Pseudomonas aeruginosa]|nr:hypothetical protein [Pseudomonas aeruginosa]